MNSDIVTFLVAQDVQSVRADVDLSWMQLGHIDEVVSFPTTIDGRTRVASPEAAWALLEIAGETADPGIPDCYAPCFVGVGGDDPYSEELLQVRADLGLTSPITAGPTAGAGAPADVLRRVGFLENATNGAETDWRLLFTSDDEFTFQHSPPGANTWTDDGTGRRDAFSIAGSHSVYILEDWWESAVTHPTARDDTVTFTTEASPDMIEMPVLFEDAGGALAFTNNVINALIDGPTMVVAQVHGHASFDAYVDVIAGILGFAAPTRSDERWYHFGQGSIHCGTNVLRAMPAVDAEMWWNMLIPPPPP